MNPRTTGALAVVLVLLGVYPLGLLLARRTG